MSARRYMLPLHHFAEQLERIYVNQRQYPFCQAFRNEERYLLREFYKGIKAEREDIKILTERFEASYQNGVADRPVLRKD